MMAARTIYVIPHIINLESSSKLAVNLTWVEKTVLLFFLTIITNTLFFIFKIHFKVIVDMVSFSS